MEQYRVKRIVVESAENHGIVSYRHHGTVPLVYRRIYQTRIVILLLVFVVILHVYVHRMEEAGIKHHWSLVH